MTEIYANWRADGLTAAFYRTDVHEPDQIPPEAKAISEEVWLEFLGGGKRWNGSALEPYEPPPPPPAVPQSVFDYQFAGEAEARHIITLEECDAWVGPGVIPPTLLAKVEQIIPDPEARRPVVLFLKGSKAFPRYHANTEALAALFGLDTNDEIDAFFVSAGQR